MELQVAGQRVFCHHAGGRGNSALPTAVFLHGALHDRLVWAPQARHLARHGCRVLAPDLPGHGRSAGPALNSIEDMANWLRALLDAAGVAQTLLIGHSMGALIALETAHRAPGRVRAIAMLGAAYPMKVSDALLEAALTDEAGAIDMINKWSHSAAPDDPAAQDRASHLLASAKRRMQRVARLGPAHLLHTDFSACNAYAGGDTAARALRCPALFICGSADKMTPSKASAPLIAAVPRARVETLLAGHALMEEQPARVAEILRDFATSLPGEAAELSSPT
ncbi:MAG: alpha/beta hydrolase [Massilia sp.]